MKAKTIARKKPQRQRNQRGEGIRLREEAMQAAMRILDRSPAGQLSLRAVAKEAGVSAPSLYRQFEDANSMLKEVMSECWRQVADAMLAENSLSGNGRALEILKAQMCAYVRYAMERPSRYQLLFALPLGWQAEFEGPLRPAYRAVLETILQLQKQGGRLPTADAVSSAILTISCVHGRIAIAHLAPARPGNSAARIQEYACDVLDRLFAAPATTRRSTSKLPVESA